MHSEDSQPQFAEMVNKIDTNLASAIPAETTTEVLEKDRNLN
jgi:hypothetical protein